MRRWLPLLLLSLAACSTAPKKTPPPSAGGRSQGSDSVAGSSRSGEGCVGRYAPAQEDVNTRGDYVAGGLYKPGVSDSTPDHVPEVDCIAEPQIVDAPRSAYGNRSPYQVLGKHYKVMDEVDGYVERGTASYYGAKFHGRKTSNHEVYDMYAFTAAHKTLPLPSFALVTNLDNERSVVVRVNDRGPFHDGRVVDLSYAAAVKLGITARGTGRVEVRALTPDSADRVLAGRKSGPSTPASRAAPAVKTSVATGVPTRVARGKPTPMDDLVGALPAKAATAASAPAPVRGAEKAPAAAATAVTNASPSQPWRYHVAADTRRKPSAEHFDAWMQSRGVRVATGKPAAVAAADADQGRGSSKDKEPAKAPAPAPPASALKREVASVAAAPMALLLQVASFASRENADRALQRLTSAGIAGARISDIRSNGRTLWRLRVDAADRAMAEVLAGRIAGLGFARPHLVED